jgi:hypothetical protein
MLSAKLLLGQIVTSLRQVIGPAISEPYPKAQAYMAATILEFVSRQIEERGTQAEKTTIIDKLYDDLSGLDLPVRIMAGDSRDETALSGLIERLYSARGEIGVSMFETANRRVRQALRELLDLELTTTGKSGD